MCVSIFKVYSLLQLHHLLYFIYSTVIKVTMAYKFLIYILICFLKIMKCIKIKYHLCKKKKISEGKNFYLFCSLKYSQCLEQCLVHCRHSIYICKMKGYDVSIKYYVMGAYV